MVDATEIKKKVEAREKQLSTLHKRMDADFDLWNNKQFTFDSHETSINVTTNHPRTFADDIYAPLSRAEMQIIVRMAEAEGEDKREDIGKLERLFYFLLELADLRLRQMLLPPARDWLIWFFNVRGWSAARVLIEKPKTDTIISNFTPCDPRWMTWEIGKDGLLWGAYKTFRSKADLEATYGKELSTGFHFPWRREKDSLPVIDHWKGTPGKMVNTVICEDTVLLGPTTHDLPRNPFIIRPVATRPPIASESGFEVEGFGDSIYAPNRFIYALENRLYSIKATRANLLSLQPLINYYKDGGKTDITDTLMRAEGVFNLPMDLNRLESVPMKEVPMTLLDMSGELRAMREHAELPRIDIGKPPPSGTLFNLVEQSGDKIFIPQLRALNDFYADVCRMMEEQLLWGKYKVKVKTEADRKYQEYQVTPVDLKKPHIIKVEFTAITPWRQLETYTIADMAKRLGLPDRFVYEHILKLQDPQRIQRLAAMEIAEHSPKLAMLDAIEGFLAEGQVDKAKALIRDMYRMEMGEQVPEEKPPTEGEPPPEMPIETPGAPM